MSLFTSLCSFASTLFRRSRINAEMEEELRSHIEHCADEVADHVVQKAVAADAVDEQVPVLGLTLLPGGGKDGAG